MIRPEALARPAARAIMARLDRLAAEAPDLDEDREVAVMVRVRAPAGPRLTRGRYAAAKAGRHASGPAPFGYRWRNIRRGLSQIEPDPVRAPFVRMIFEEYLRLGSLVRLARELEARRIEGPRVATWSKAALGFLLRNDTYVGRVHYGQVHSKGTHRALVRPEIFEAVGRLLAKNCKSRKADA